jgi:hypothetical protein
LAGRGGRVLELAAGVSPGSEHGASLLALLVPAGVGFRRCCGGHFGYGEGSAASTLGLGGADPRVVQRQAGVGAVPHQMAGEKLPKVSVICFVIGLGAVGVAREEERRPLSLERTLVGSRVRGARREEGTPLFQEPIDGPQRPGEREKGVISTQEGR